MNLNKVKDLICGAELNSSYNDFFYNNSYPVFLQYFLYMLQNQLFLFELKKIKNVLNVLYFYI